MEVSPTKGSLFIVLICPILFNFGVEALLPPERYLEGTCSRMHYTPVAASRQVIDSFPYIMAGSKFHVYGITSGLRNYRQIREDEVLYEACLARNTSTTTGNNIAAVFGFGDQLMGGTFRVSTRPGIYFSAVPSNSYGDEGGFSCVVTLTDHRTFAFLIHCENGSDARSWNVVTKERHLPEKTMRLIRSHARSLGFKEENFVFMRGDSCHHGHGYYGNHY